MKIYDALQSRGRIRPDSLLSEPLPATKRGAKSLPVGKVAAEPLPTAKLVAEPPPAKKRGFLPPMDLLSLFQSLQGILDADAPRVLQFMSATSGEGTSTITRELAAAVAEATGLKVVLVKASRGARRATDSLSGTLLGNEPLDRVLTRVPGESYLTAELGVVAQQDSHSFLAQRMPDLFERLLAKVDLIIIDGSPALANYGGLATVRHVGGVVLVVEAERTSSSAVNHARQMIEANGGHLLGVILNKRRSFIPRLKNIQRLISRWQ